MNEPMPEAEELQAALKEASKDVMVTSYNFEMFLDAVEFLSGGDAGRAKIAEKWPGADYGTVAVVRANGRGLREGTYFTSPVTALQTGKHGVTIKRPSSISTDGGAWRIYASRKGVARRPPSLRSRPNASP